MHERIKKLRNEITIGVVGGSDLVKQKEQLGDDGTCQRSLSLNDEHL
jgi:phosphomannomutase